MTRPGGLVRSYRAFVAAPAALALAASAALAQTPARTGAIDPYGVANGPTASGAACPAAEYRQFDFWVGNWEVVSPAGVPLGINVISREAGGCAVQESWTDGNGGRGRSLNAYDPADRRWHQHWVFAGGGPSSVVHYAGRLAGRRMVLGGTREFVNGLRIQDLGVWTAHGADSVQQEFYTLFSDTTRPGVFDGRYRRRPNATPAAEQPFPTCAARARNHDLDFTAGVWDVHIADSRAAYAAGGTPAGRSEIRADLSHCLLEERYRGSGGHEVLAYTAYSPVTGRWERTHADSRGTRIFLDRGEPAPGGGLVMRGRSPLPGDSTTLLRVTWEPVDSATFRQRWESSRDGGKKWEAVQVATYVRRRA